MSDRLRAIAEADGRYRVEAYIFVYEALTSAQHLFNRRSHVTGQELCKGIRRLALDRYGRMARTVLESWGVRTTDDFGAIVYVLIDHELMTRTDEDRIEDFHAVYDFEDAFVRNYRIPGNHDGHA